MLLCKTWTSHNFSSPLDCYKNNTVQHFDAKIRAREDMKLVFPQSLTIYNVSFCLNKYILKFNGGIFLRHPV